MKSLPCLNFAHLPTSIEPAQRLSASLGGPRLFVKRDDQTGLAMGGNKTRKLEFLLAEAQEHGARTLLTAGAAQSNHCRQTAAAAARFGMDCILVLTGEPPSRLSGNLLLDNLLGAEVVWATQDKRDQALQEAFQQAQDAGRQPYLIPYGGSNATGAAAFAFAMQELMEQVSSGSTGLGNQPPDWIVFASSSGGTQAGLILGGRISGFRGQVLGISVDKTADILKNRIASLANAGGELLDERVNFSPDEVLVNADYLGGGYGVVGKPEVEALHLFAQAEGLLLDPVYTARAAAGLVDLIRRRFFEEGQTILFWHTGGTPALFADEYQDFDAAL